MTNLIPDVLHDLVLPFARHIISTVYNPKLFPHRIVGHFAADEKLEMFVKFNHERCPWRDAIRIEKAF